MDKNFDEKLKQTLLIIQQISRNKPQVVEELYKYKSIYKNIYSIFLEYLERSDNNLKNLNDILESMRPEIEPKPIKNKEISIIIPHRDNGQKDRQLISKWCIKRYKYLFPNAEIILSDCGKIVFSRGGSINKGVEKANGNYIIIADNDYLFGQQLAKNLVNNYKWTVCTTKENYYFLNTPITTKILQMDTRVKLNKINFNGNIKSNPFNMWGGIIAMPKKNFIKFDTNMFGYGYDDTCFYDCMRAYHGNPHRTKSLMYHMEHQRIRGSTYMQRSYANKDYYDREWRTIRNDFKLVQQKCVEKGLSDD